MSADRASIFLLYERRKRQADFRGIVYLCDESELVIFNDLHPRLRFGLGLRGFFSYECKEPGES